MSDLLAQISALMATPGGDIERIERTLTDGYAHALSLEGERHRLEQRLKSVAAGVGAGDFARHAQELSELALRLNGNESELDVLRAQLSELRRHAAQVRRGAAPAVEPH